jgi:plasmid maintenance system antidote protein VapI
MPKRLPITDLLREAINEGDVSFLKLQKETGVLRQSLMKFARGESTIHLDAADKLADYFGLELGPASKPKRKGK